MPGNTGSLRAAAKKCWRSSVLATSLGAALLFPGSAAWAQGQAAADPNAPALRLIKIIPIKGTAANPTNKLFSFDISWVDPTTGLYFLADRSNAALDVIDTKTNTLFGQIGGPAPNGAGFAGDTGNTATSGPNGVTVSPNSSVPCIFATDSSSTGGGRVVSFNYGVSFTAPASSIKTGGSGRADELAFDPKDNLLLVINNADNPPYGSLISVSSGCALSLVKQFPFTSPVNATGGAEQPVWDPGTQKFYLAIPNINGSSTTGGVLRISTSGVFENFYPINFCGPGGLTLGPNEDLLVGCNTVFDTSGNTCTGVNAGAGTATNPGNAATLQSLGAIVPAKCTGVAAPQSVICNGTPGRDCKGNALVSVPGNGGGDEVWFNKGDGNYYVTGGNNPGGPVFSVVASGANTPPDMLTQLVPTLYAQLQQGVTNTPSFVHSAGTVHSIAASAANNQVYVPLPANTAYPNCVQGCIAVFSAQ